MMKSRNIFIICILSLLVTQSSFSLDLDLTGRIVTIHDPDYPLARLTWNLYFSRYPLAIVYAQNTQDVVNALHFCRKNKIPFRIRSGGHSFEGWSSIDGGIIIDLSDMHKIKVDKKKKLAYVQAGAKQGSIVSALGLQGFAIPTGIEKDPGIAGVTLGGGIGLLIREFGLACDHLKEVEIVTASGEVLHASRDKHPDLFFACQGGGGGNFGIVTEFVFSIIPVGNVALYQITYPYETLEVLLDTWQRWAPTQTKRLNSILSLHPKGMENHNVLGIFDGSQEELFELLAPMLAIEGSQLVALKTTSYLESFLFFADFPSPPIQAKISSGFVYQFLPPEAMHAIKLAMDNPVNANANVFFLACGGIMRKIPRESTAFWNRKSLFYLEWEEDWTDNKEAAPSIRWVENLRLALQPFIKGSYINVPDFDIVHWEKEYYGKNFSRLKKIKTKYDPYNIFTFELQAIPKKNRK